MTSGRLRRAVGLALLLIIAIGVWPALAAGLPPPRQACAAYQAWTIQTDPATDVEGLSNLSFPEASSTAYFTTPLTGSIGSVVAVRGQYPLARFMSLEIYTGDQLVDYMNDVNIRPDAGQNNPFVSGTANGTYTGYVAFGQKPANPPPNTLYTGTLTSVTLIYRVYHSTNPGDPAGSTTHPRLPILWSNGQAMANCPVQPIIQPADASVWGRLDNGDWIGTPPTPAQQLSVTNPPPWAIQDPFTGHFFPNGANYYMGATLSRQFLQPHTSKNIYVLRFKAPTYPKTRSGEAVYLDRQVRFWSLCSDEPYTTNVIRCIPDDAAVLDANGFATFVISDPGSRPTGAAMASFKASWLAWGALNLPTDVVFDDQARPWGVTSPVHFYDALIYRQTLANPTFTQSLNATSLLPPDQQKAAMGPYWPIGGYCSTANFETYGVACLKH
jgi:hypothetical protein